MVYYNHSKGHGIPRFKKVRKKMTLTKGMKIKQTKVNGNEMFKNSTANSVLVYEVVKVNKKTYELKCVEGFMQGSGCKIQKDFKTEYEDVYGTVTKWELVA